ncbi:Inosine/uridine-preferring nucleoside hydrolase [Calocera cornea HHB12733]|uniref:Inosine/uridine-preferring nucleoside hydrolase n=1 Tax=Calocera cornea HHB12733 TaxID=1353952 RepID=A0A165IL76_9BASI|nr:Inosine/uridine-preferring nucleoside hydrolase [Calocera cornea HHB12733]
MAQRKKVWLDCDPGHDDAIALLMGLYMPEIELIGVSTVFGNTNATDTYQNAVRLLHAFAAPAHITAYPGAVKPLIRAARIDAEIHGAHGLGGTEGLAAFDHEEVQVRHQAAGAKGAVQAMAEAFRAVQGKLTLVSTGPMTNSAALFSAYPELVDKVESVVFMGGGVGLGNRSPVAEYNILCDPEAAQIVFDLPIPKVMVPLNVTHTAIFDEDAVTQLVTRAHPTSAHVSLDSVPTSPLRHTLYTLIHFFASTYKAVFDFDGPPIHDAVAMVYVARPELFEARRYRVDVELAGLYTAGETVVDLWDYRKCDDSWGPTGKNILLTEKLDVPKFIDLFLECVDKADKVSPLNVKKA